VRLTRTVVEEMRLARERQQERVAELSAEFLQAHDQTRALALGNLDTDGDLDLVVGNHGTSVSPQRNQVFRFASGRFNAHDELIVAEPTGALALVDLDGDGALDLVEANDARSANRGSRVFRGIPNARFNNQSTRIAEGVWSRGVDVVDIDGDGDIDILFAVYNGAADQIWLHDGALGFTQDTQIGTNLTDTRSRDISGADVDGDGDADVTVVSDISDPNRVHLNR